MKTTIAVLAMLLLASTCVITLLAIGNPEHHVRTERISFLLARLKLIGSVRQVAHIR